MTSINIDAILTDTVRYQVAEWLETRKAKYYRVCEDAVVLKCMYINVTGLA